MHIEIVPPERTELAGHVSEVATETRAWIEAFKGREVSPDDVKSSLSKEHITELKEQGKKFFNTFGDSAFSRALEGIEAIKCGMTVALLSVYGNWEHLTPARNESNSYVLEGAVSAYSRWLHSMGLKAADAKGHHAALLRMLMVPIGTSGGADGDQSARVGRIQKAVAPQDYRYNRFVCLAGNESVQSAYVPWSDAMCAAAEAYPDIHFGEHERIAICAAALWYTEGDTPMVAGFLSIDDLMKMRFTRRTLGSYIQAVTGDPEKARIAVDEVRKKAAKVDGLRFIPNDAKFSIGYRAGATGRYDLGSCMSRSADAYANAPYDQHPVDSYSAAYYGAGDNGLALVMSLDEDGEIRGRGILNTANDSIVRWYGEHKDKLALEALGITIDDDCLDESWLAFVHDGKHCLVPYSDGSGYGERDGNRIIIGRGEIDIQMTGGGAWYSDEDCYEDCITGNMYPESELESQDNDTWYHPDNVGDGFRCAVDNCWYPDGYATRVWLNGESVWVSYTAYHGDLENEYNGWMRIDDDSWIDDEHCVTHDGETELKRDCVEVDDVWYLEGDEPQEEEDEAA